MSEIIKSRDLNVMRSNVFLFFFKNMLLYFSKTQLTQTLTWLSLLRSNSTKSVTAITPRYEH